MIDEEEAVIIATVEFEKTGASASNYHISIEPYGADASNWIVWFEWKSPFPIPGGRSAVLVHRETGDTQFMPGE